MVRKRKSGSENLTTIFLFSFSFFFPWIEEIIYGKEGKIPGMKRIKVKRDWGKGRLI
jgi:hypothetical protein